MLNHKDLLGFRLGHLLERAADDFKLALCIMVQLFDAGLLALVIRTIGARITRDLSQLQWELSRLTLPYKSTFRRMLARG